MTVNENSDMAGTSDVNPTPDVNHELEMEEARRTIAEQCGNVPEAIEAILDALDGPIAVDAAHQLAELWCNGWVAGVTKAVTEGLTESTSWMFKLGREVERASAAGRARTEAAALDASDATAEELQRQYWLGYGAGVKDGEERTRRDSRFDPWIALTDLAAALTRRANEAGRAGDRQQLAEVAEQVELLTEKVEQATRAQEIMRRAETVNDTEENLREALRRFYEQNAEGNAKREATVYAEGMVDGAKIANGIDPDTGEPIEDDSRKGWRRWLGRRRRS